MKLKRRFCFTFTISKIGQTTNSTHFQLKTIFKDQISWDLSITDILKASVNSMMYQCTSVTKSQIQTDSVSVWSKLGKTVPLGHWTISFETKTDHVLACLEIKFRTNKNTIIFAKSSMVFPWPVVILQNCVQYHFPLRGNFLYSKRLILDPIDGTLSFSPFCQLCLKRTK